LTALWPPNRQKLASLAIRTVAGSVAIVLVACGLFAVRLWQGPLTISGLGHRIAEALDARVGHRFDFRLGETALVGRARFPTFSIDSLAMAQSDGRTILAAPRAEVSIDLLPLLAGMVTPKQLEIFDVELRLSLLPDGSLALPTLMPLGSAPTPAEAATRHHNPAPAPPPFVPPTVQNDRANAPPDNPARSARDLTMAQVMATVRAAIDMLTAPESPIGAIDKIAITRGRLVIDDRTADRTLTFSGLDVSFVKSRDATTFDLSVDGPNGRWSAAGSAYGSPGAERGLTLALKNLSLDEILLASSARSLGADTNMPASIETRLALAPDGSLSTAGGRFELGAGYLRFDDPEDEPMLIEGITGGFRLVPATGHILIERGHLVSGTTIVSVNGTVVPPSDSGSAWSLDLRAAEPAIIGPERPGQVPVRIDNLELTARLFFEDKNFVIDRFAFSGPDCGFAMAGTVDWWNGPRVRLGASISPTKVKTVLRLWPSFMVAPVRAWLLAHATEGTFQNGTLQVDFDAPTIEAMRAERAPPDDAVLLDFTIAGGGVELFPGVPPMRGFNGKGHVTGRTSSFAVTNGVIDLGDGRSILVPDGAFQIPDADLKPVPATVTARVSASVDTIAKLLTYESLKPYARVPVDLSTMRGQVDGKLSLGMKLEQNARPEDNPLEIHATIGDFAADRIFGTAGLESATAVLDIAPNSLKAVGQGRIFGAPASFDVSQTGFKPAKALVKLTLDEAFLTARGFGASRGIGGSIGAVIAAPLGGTDKPTAEVELDLAKATLDLPGISKSEGRPGRIAFTFLAKDRASTLDRVLVEVPPLEARGSVDLSADLALQSARFPIVKLSAGDDMKVDAMRFGDAVKVIVRGSSIDARPFLKTVLFAPSERKGSAVAPPPTVGDPNPRPGIKEIEIDVKTGLLSGYNKSVLGGAEVSLVKRGEELTQLSVAGRFGREPLSGNLTGAPAAPLFNLSTEDAGSLLAFLDLYTHMERGRLSVGMRLDRGSLDGVLVIKDFVLRDEPALRRLVDEGVPANAPGRQTKIDTGAVPFNNLQVRFQRNANRLVLTDGTMSGTAIGLTVDGWLDHAGDRVDVTGTFIPAFALNNMFSQIPVFGTILGGGRNEGLFGVNYRIEGRVSAPTLSINPLSVIAPGIFRKIFEVGDQLPGAAQ
jgi:hypothetical protein